MSPKADPKNPNATYGQGGGQGCSRLITIKLTKRGIVNHKQYGKVGECVQWNDQTNVSRVLKFDRWPFTEPWQAISVPAGGLSNTFHVAPVPVGPYPYYPDPPMPVGPPDPPEFDVG